LTQLTTDYGLHSIFNYNDHLNILIYIEFVNLIIFITLAK